MDILDGCALVYSFDVSTAHLGDTDCDCVLLSFRQNGDWCVYSEFGVDAAAFWSQTRAHDVGAFQNKSDCATINGNSWQNIRD